MCPFNASKSKPVPPFGLWASPVSMELVTTGTLGFSDLQVDGEAVYWLEARAAERGRRALVRWTPSDGAHDALDFASDVGTYVHEYGGGAYTASGGHIIYSERSDGSVRLVRDGRAREIATVPGCRYAAFAVDERRGRMYAVREDHRERPRTNPHNAVVALALEPADPARNAGEVIFGGTDFVLAPQLSPDGDRLAFVGWNQPLMPWDATQLFVTTLDAAGNALAVRAVAGDANESIVAAAWSPSGSLIFASDRTNWWNLYAWQDDSVTALAPVDAEIGEPPWVFGRRAFFALDDTRALCAVISGGRVRAASIGAGSLTYLPFGSVDTTPLPYGDGAVYIATPADAPSSVRRARTLTDTTPDTLRAAADTALDPGDVSIGEALEIPTSDGERTHVTLYRPRNAQARPADGRRPPLIVMSHGGPTAMHATKYDIGIAWWTTRGFAVAHVNYRGSTGFGRAYRTRLDGEWGVVDVIDCISAARWLAERGACDAARIAIRGSSASGMTTLLAAATSNAFAAATSLYGVMDLMALAAETHKLEARYVDGLIGPLPAMRARYHDRSPINHVEGIDAPVLILQGLDDRVVPPDQATSMRDALRERGVRVDYEAFAGEGHGFRQAETIRRVHDLELDFYRDVLNLS